MHDLPMMPADAVSEEVKGGSAASDGGTEAPHFRG